MKKYIFLILLFGCYLSSCTKQDRDNTIIDQEESIDNYISSLGANAKVIRNGNVSRVIVKEGSGEEIVAGDSVIFYYAAYIFSSGKGELFATNNIEVAKASEFKTDGKLERRVVGSKDMLVGLSSGLVGAKRGETCNIVFSAKYGYNNTVVYNVPKLSPLFFEVWIESIIKN
ncbi:MAG: FKBP-type peptidyl-prolyl cis-trans isomerase [Bacteroidales bacterium]